MKNLAKDRLKMLLKIMRVNNWPVFYFPGGNNLRFTQLLVLLERGQELRHKGRPAHMRAARQCWRNAQATEREDQACVYWEGVIANRDSAWPTPHAWNVKDGKVIDTTVRAAYYDYFGVPGKLFTE